MTENQAIYICKKRLGAQIKKDKKIYSELKSVCEYGAMLIKQRYEANELYLESVATLGKGL